MDDCEAHRTVLRKAASSLSPSNGSISAVDLGAGADSAMHFLPDLEEPRPSLVPLCLHRSCTDEPDAAGASQVDSIVVHLPRRSVSSEMTGSTRTMLAQNSSMNVEDVLSNSASQSLKRKASKRGSQIIVGERGPDSDITEAHSVVYSSWFALLSKSMGSDIGSPSWLASSSKQIEGI